MATERKTRSDKKAKVLVSISQEDHEKLKKLGISCDKTKTSLAGELLSMCLNHVSIVQHYQDMYNKHEEYRVIPVKRGNKIVY